VSSLQPAKRHFAWGSLLASLLWLGGFEVLPMVHMAFHDAFGAHQHGVRRDSHAHEDHHDGHAHHHHDHGHHHDDHGYARDHGKQDDPGHDDGDTPAHHGDNSLAHRHLAAEHSLPEIPPVPHPLVVRDRVFERAIESVYLEGQRVVSRARGPPGDVESPIV
jgi:hypothetical protein